MKKVKYNFVQYKWGDLCKYYDVNNVVSLSILKSGWKGYYNCILEWGEYQQSELKYYTAFDIENFYGIKTFLRKEKLNKINENSLQERLFSF